jgi:hypothetical protein
MAEQPIEPITQINAGEAENSKGKEKNHEQEDEPTPKGFTGKAPTVFDGDRKNSKAFISDLEIYFRLNRKRPDIKNYYSRVLLALSYIKGPNVVNWVEQQVEQLDRELNTYDEEEIELWENFVLRFKRNFVSTTKKEDAFVKIMSLKMKSDQLDEYIADHGALVADLEWDPDTEMACHSFRQGLPAPLAKKILDQEGFPETMNKWIRLVQKYHSRFAMGKALGYYGGKGKDNRNAWQHNAGKPNQQKKKDQDPNAMDVDRTQMDPAKKERLFKTGSCFKCEKQGHLARDCPKRTTAQEAKVEEVEKQPPLKKIKDTTKSTEQPPSYDTLIKQINACTLEQRQKLLETFSNAGDSEEEDF